MSQGRRATGAAKAPSCLPTPEPRGTIIDVSTPAPHLDLHDLPRRRAGAFAFVAERLWLDFVNTEDVRRGGSRADALTSFVTFVDWLVDAGVLDGERASTIRRRAEQQPAGATAVLLDARRIRDALRQLAERASVARVRADALDEINRILGRSAGTRRVEVRDDGAFSRSFVPVGDAFAGLLIPVVDSAADALVLGELPRVRCCADPRCTRVFFDNTRNARRRWCDMAVCGNRAKAARHRLRIARGPAS